MFTAKRCSILDQQQPVRSTPCCPSSRFPHFIITKDDIHETPSSLSLIRIPLPVLSPSPLMNKNFFFPMWKRYKSFSWNFLILFYIWTLNWDTLNLNSCSRWCSFVNVHHSCASVSYYLVYYNSLSSST